MNLFKKILIVVGIVVAISLVYVATKGGEENIVGVRQFTDYTVLDAVSTTTGTSKVLLVEDFRHSIFSFATDGGGDAALTVKFLGSIQDLAPDFDDSQSATNTWDYIQTIDLEDGSAINGDTGVSVATTDDYRLLEANINGLKWITAKMTARTEGEVTVRAQFLNND